jgi:hypothetical protein
MSLLTWLALREPADTRARSVALTEWLAAALPDARPIRCVDLGSGSGANIRYLTSRLPAAQQWLAVDRDPELLAAGPPGTEKRSVELGTLDGGTLIAGRDLVTASALLDLVSPRWIEDLAHTCRAAGAAVLFALTYDGRSECTPREPEDDVVLELFNAHQRASDKGFGRAAGPDAPAIAASSLTRAGYVVRRERSDWHLRPDEQDLQRALVSGWAEAASEQSPAHAQLIGEWFRRRLSHIEAGRSHIVVGHEDLASVVSNHAGDA